MANYYNRKAGILFLIFILTCLSACNQLSRFEFFKKTKYPLKINSPHSGLLLIEVVDSSLVQDQDTRFDIKSSHLEEIEGMDVPIEDNIDYLGQSYNKLWVQIPTRRGYEHSIEIQTLEHRPYFPEDVIPSFLHRLDEFEYVIDDSLEIIFSFSDSLEGSQAIAFRSSETADTLLLFDVGTETPEEFVHTLDIGGIGEMRVHYDYRLPITRITFNRVDTTLSLGKHPRFIQKNHLRIKLPYRKWIYRTEIYDELIQLTTRDTLEITPSLQDSFTIKLATSCDEINSSEIEISTNALDSLWIEKTEMALSLNLQFKNPILSLADSAEFSEGKYIVRYTSGMTNQPDTTIEIPEEPEIPPPPVISFEKIGSIGKQGIKKGEFNYPEGVLFDRDGFLWVCDNRNKRIQKFSIDGEVIRIIGTPQSHRFPINAPRDIAFTPSGTLYIADYLDGSIKYWDAETDSISTLIEYDTPPILLSSPLGLFFHRSHIFVTDMKHRILELDEQGNLIGEIGVSVQGKNVLSRPHGLFVDDRQRIWVADKGNNRICQFSSEGKLIRKFRKIQGMGNLKEPTDVILYKNLVFIVDPGLKAVVVADTLGRKAGLLRNSFKYPFSIDVSPSVNTFAISDRTNHSVELYHMEIDREENASR